jgi:hypothetical protein
MSQYELLSIVLSCVAAITSLVVWTGQRKLQREANDLQRATSELAKKQLELLLRGEKGRNTARLSLALVRDGKSFRFQIKNISDVDATNVDMTLLVERPQDNPIIESEYKEKFPAKRLPPGSTLSLIAALHLGSPSAFNALLKWVNPDGSTSQEETYAAL